MKRRIDFVSNSSSSSFLLLADEDTEFNSDEYRTIDWEQYKRDWLGVDVLTAFDPWCWPYGERNNIDLKQRIKFVPDEEYYDLWRRDDVFFKFPESCRKNVEKLVEIIVNNTKPGDALSFNGYRIEEYYKLKDRVFEQVVAVLEPKTKDFIFHEIEGDDHCYRNPNYENQEEEMRERFYSVDKTFSRTRNDH